jgi:hypothetical protein
LDLSVATITHPPIAYALALALIAATIVTIWRVSLSSAFKWSSAPPVTASHPVIQLSDNGNLKTPQPTARVDATGRHSVTPEAKLLTFPRPVELSRVGRWVAGRL